MTTDTPARRAADEIVIGYGLHRDSAGCIAAIIEKHMVGVPVGGVIKAPPLLIECDESESADDAPPPQPGTIAALLADGTITPETRVLGTPYMTTDGAWVVDYTSLVWVFEYASGGSRWTGNIIQMKYCRWDELRDTGHDGWHAKGTIHTRYQDKCPDGKFGCYSTRAAAEAARQKGTGDAP